MRDMSPFLALGIMVGLVSVMVLPGVLMFLAERRKDG